MNRFLILGILVIVSIVAFSIPLMSSQLADAGTNKKIQFTKTVVSSQDPGIGHGNEQLAMVLTPNNGTLYHGTLTYTASTDVQVVILHQIEKSDSKGQPIWTVNNNTVYAETLINPDSKGGTIDFTGSAIGLRSLNSSQFATTISVDGWIEGTIPESLQPTSLVSENTIKLAKAEIPVKIPLHQGLYDGKPVYFIITDSSNSDEGKQISDKQNWKVQTSLPLAQAPAKFLTTTYVFTNGLPGKGTKGYQDDVFSNTPSDKNYTPVSEIVKVRWGIGRTPEVLNSTKEILNASKEGRLMLTPTDIVMNMPQIAWPGGNMTIRESKDLSNQTSYVGGQILEVNKSKLSVTFIAHRAWGPDGRTIYYIVTSGTPEGPAKMMGLMNTPALSLLSSAARDLYYPSNGVKGGGPFGFQEGVTSAQDGDDKYSPICKVSMVNWNNPQNAIVLETMGDIAYEKAQGKITVQPASVFNNDYVIDCPIVEIPDDKS